MVLKPLIVYEDTIQFIQKGTLPTGTVIYIDDRRGVDFGGMIFVHFKGGCPGTHASNLPPQDVEEGWVPYKKGIEYFLEDVSGLATGDWRAKLGKCRGTVQQSVQITDARTNPEGMLFGSSGTGVRRPAPEPSRGAASSGIAEIHDCVGWESAGYPLYYNVGGDYGYVKMYDPANYAGSSQCHDGSGSFYIQRKGWGEFSNHRDLPDGVKRGDWSYLHPHRDEATEPMRPRFQTAQVQPASWAGRDEDDDISNDIEILMRYYSFFLPNFANERKVRAIIEDFKKKAMKAGERDWRDMMYTKIGSKRRTPDPRAEPVAGWGS